jgi:hypothetical protein
MWHARKRNIAIRRLGLLDAAHLEAHCLRLESHNARDLFGAPPEPVAVRRHVAGIDFRRDIVLAGLGLGGNIRATAHICVDSGCRWAELLLAREHRYVPAEHWSDIIRSAVDMARNASIGWLSVASLGYDAETREVLEAVGFELEGDEGTIGELCLTGARNH